MVKFPNAEIEDSTESITKSISGLQKSVQHSGRLTLSPMQYLLKKENSPKPISLAEFSPFQQNLLTPKT